MDLFTYPGIDQHLRMGNPISHFEQRLDVKYPDNSRKVNEFLMENRYFAFLLITYQGSLCAINTQACK
jgi:hypothetical protein